MGEQLTIEEMYAKYPDEWLLVENPQMSEKKKVISGTVTFHSKSRDETYRHAAQTKPAFSTMVFTGKMPKKMAFAL
jgi:hypothetical protein